MKHNSVWGKLLLLALSFVLAFSTLVSCTKDDVAALDKETDEIKTSLSTTAEDLANLKTLVNSIKATADAAAAKTALDAAIADLEAVKTTADAAATAKALADAKAAIEAAYASADTAVKAALEEALAEVKAKADAAATAAALTEAKAALESAIAGKATAADLEAAKTALNAAIADKADASALEAAKTALNAAIAGKADAEDVEALETAIADCAAKADVAALTTALNEAAAKVEAIATDVATLKDKVAALEAAIADKTDVNGIKDQLAVVNAAIAALQADSNKFADEYELATRVLFGELVVYVVDGECFAVEADKVPEGVTANVRSIDAFKALVASVQDKDYADGVLDNFKTIAATQEFFLGRAISVEAIEACFAKVETEKGSLETLVETLERILYKDSCNIVLTPTHNCDKTDGTHSEYCIVSVVKVYEKIVANKIEISDKLEARYDLLVAAYTNMVAAEEASKAVENKILAADATVLYRDKASVLTAVEAYDNFKGTYFGADKLAYTVFYGPSSVTAEDLASGLITNYDVMRKHEARLYKLEEAGKAAAALSASFTSAEWNNEERPLYNKAATLADEVKAFKAWIAEYTLEEVNVKRIVGDKYEILCVASDYATAMNKIWETYNETGVKASIVDAIAALKGAEDKAKTLITEKDAVAAIRVLVNGLDVAIKAVDINNDQVADYTAKDGNFVAMVGDLANFVAIEARIAELLEAEAKIEALYTKYEALFAEGKVIGISDYDALVACRDDITAICTDYAIAYSAEAESNYQQIVAEIQAKWDALAADYKAKTKSLLDAYKAAMAILDNDAYNAAYPIAYANPVITAANMVTTAITTHKVGTAHVKFLDEETADGVNFIDLLDQLYAVASNIDERALLAEKDFVAVKKEIDDLAGLNFKKLDNKAAVDEAYAAIAEWVDEYLDPTAIDDEGKINEAVVIAAVAAIKEAKQYDGDASNYEYKLLTATVLESVCAANKTMNDTYGKASAAWGDVDIDGTVAYLLNKYAGMVEGPNVTYTIHTDFAVIDKAYADYRAEYYNENSAVYIYFNEDVAYAAFKTTYDGFNVFYEAAVNEAKRINDAIDAIEALEVNIYNNKENAAKYLADTNKLIADIEAFNATYDKACGCNEWFKDNLLALYKANFIADVMNDAYAKDINQTNIFSTYVIALLNNAESIDEARIYWNTAKEFIATK